MNANVKSKPDSKPGPGPDKEQDSSEFIDVGDDAGTMAGEGFTMGQGSSNSEANHEVLALIDRESRGKSGKRKPRAGKAGGKTRTSLKQVLYQNSRRSELDAQMAEAEGQSGTGLGPGGLRRRRGKGKGSGKSKHKSKPVHSGGGDGLTEGLDGPGGPDAPGPGEGNLRRHKRPHKSKGKHPRGDPQSDPGDTMTMGQPNRKLLSLPMEPPTSDKKVHTNAKADNKIKTKHIPKPAMFKYLLSVVTKYHKVWLLDEDISLVGFDIAQFMYHSVCGRRSTPYAPTSMLVTQPLVGSQTQDRLSVSYEYWNKMLHIQDNSLNGGGSSNSNGINSNKDSEDKGVIVGIHTGFVESQAPLFDTDYFIWYSNYIVEPLRNEILKHQSGWGPGHTVCKI